MTGCASGTAPGPNRIVGMMTATRQGFGPEVKRRVPWAPILSADCYEEYYRPAQRSEPGCGRDFAAAYRRCDLL